MSAQPESRFEPPASAQVVWLPTRDDAQLLLESSGECTFITDRDGRILALNPMAQQLVGRTRDVVGQGFRRGSESAEWSSVETRLPRLRPNEMCSVWHD